MVRPDVAEAMRLATTMMRDSWATGNDAAWQPGYQALEAHLNSMVAAERERCLHLARYALSCAKNTEWSAAEDALDRIEGPNVRGNLDPTAREET